MNLPGAAVRGAAGMQCHASPCRLPIRLRPSCWPRSARWPLAAVGRSDRGSAGRRGQGRRGQAADDRNLSRPRRRGARLAGSRDSLARLRHPDGQTLRRRLDRAQKARCCTRSMRANIAPSSQPPKHSSPPPKRIARAPGRTSSAMSRCSPKTRSASRSTTMPSPRPSRRRRRSRPAARRSTRRSSASNTPRSARRMTGRIGASQVFEGALITAGQTQLATISDDDPAWVYFSLSEAELLDYQRRYGPSRARPRRAAARCAPYIERRQRVPATGPHQLRRPGARFDDRAPIPCGPNFRTPTTRWCRGSLRGFA